MFGTRLPPGYEQYAQPSAMNQYATYAQGAAAGYATQAQGYAGAAQGAAQGYANQQYNQYSNQYANMQQPSYASGASAQNPEDAVQDKQQTPETVPRSCTDPIWCLIFVICFAAFVGVWIYAGINGKYDRFFDLRNDQGQLCGRDAAVKNQPYLFFCMTGLHGFDYSNRKCVASCPASNAVNLGLGAECPVSYPTKRYFENICIPTEGITAHEFFNMTTSHPSFVFVMSFSDIPRGSWKPIVISAGITVILAFLYLLLVQKCAETLFVIGIGSIIICSTLTGLYFGYAGLTGGADGWPYTGDAKRDLLIGLVALVISAVFTCVVICRRESLYRAVCCLKAAGECIWDVPILLLEPFINLLFKGTVFIILLLGLLLLLSCGHVDIGNDPDAVNFHYGQEEWYMVGYYALMFIWILELCSAFHHFVVSYAVESWFFSDVNSQQDMGQHGACLSCSLCKGYCAAWKYHLGTLACGSLIVAIFRAIQILISCMEEASKDQGNAVLKCVFCCLRICVGCCVECVSHLTKNAYMATALNADNFCTSAKLALQVLADNATAVISLKGATFFFELAGLGGLTAAGVYMTFLQLKWSPEFNDRKKETYVSDPTGTLVVAGIACFIVAWPFMALFANASDVILFCYAVQERRKTAVAKMAASAEGAFSSLTNFVTGLFGGRVCTPAAGSSRGYQKGQPGAGGNYNFGAATQEMLHYASAVPTQQAIR